MRYYFGDHLGTTHMITDTTSVKCYDADYTPFGQELAYMTTCSQKFDFTALERDTEANKDHAFYRDFEWNRGRWISPDFDAGDITHPQSLNRYAYVLNNPSSLTDPAGLGSGNGVDITKFCPHGNCQLPLGAPIGWDIFDMLGARPIEAFGDSFWNGEWGRDPLGYAFLLFASSPDPGESGGITTLPLQPFSATQIAGLLPSCLQVTGQSIDNSIRKIRPDSPLIGQGNNFVAAGWDNGVDPRFLAALTMETSYGTNIRWGAYNAWNWGYNKKDQSNSPFDSWADGMNKVAYGIANQNNFFRGGNTSTFGVYIAGGYCTSPGCATRIDPKRPSGLENLNWALKRIGGNPADVTCR